MTKEYHLVKFCWVSPKKVNKIYVFYINMGLHFQIYALKCKHGFTHPRKYLLSQCNMSNTPTHHILYKAQVKEKKNKYLSNIM